MLETGLDVFWTGFRPFSQGEDAPPEG